MKWNHARVASNIRRLQKAKGWKHIHLAEASGVSYQKIRTVLSDGGVRGQERFYAEEFLALAQALGVQAEELAFGSFSTSRKVSPQRSRRTQRKGG